MCVYTYISCGCVLYACVLGSYLLAYVGKCKYKKYRSVIQICMYVCMYLCMYVCMYVCRQLTTCIYAHGCPRKSCQIWGRCYCLPSLISPWSTTVRSDGSFTSLSSPYSSFNRANVDNGGIPKNCHSKITPARDPKQCGGQEVNVPDTSNSRYGKVTDEVRHDRNCSSRTFYIDHIKELTRSSYKNLPQRIFKILMHGPSEEDVNRISSRFSHKDQYEIIEDQEDCTRTSSRASPQDLYKVTQRP